MGDSHAGDLEGAGVALGEILRGKYRVERILGSGGMGTVVLATNLRLDQRVAIKLLSKASAARPTIAARFAREARSAAKLRSDHVVRILDVDDTDDGRPFMVMERLEGEDLDAVLAREGPLAVTRAVDLVLQACEGLAEAHAVGIVHRDLKPANLFLARRADRSPVVKLLDFGISKVADPASEADVGLTHDAAIVGTPTYMSPEQLKSSRDVDARADLWSLGVVLHQLLSGELPFPATSVAALAAQIASDPPRPVRLRSGVLPAGLGAAIARCLEKDPDRRFADVLGLASAIAPFAGELDATRERLLRIASIANAPPRIDSAPMRSAAPDAETVVAPRITASLAHTAGAAVRVTAPLQGSVSSSVAGSVTEHPLGTSPLPAPRRRDRVVIAAAAISIVGVAAFFAFGRGPAPSATPPPSHPPASSSTAAASTAASPAETASSSASSSNAASVASASASAPSAAALAPTKGPVAKPTPTTKNPLEIKLK